MAGQFPSAKNKAELRSAVLQKRDELTTAVARAHSRALCERLTEIERLASLTAIAGYASIRNEIDASGFLARRQREGAELFFPRVDGPGELDFVRVDDLDALVPGAFGVPEPDGAPAALAEIDAFLVPGVAFDRQGRRLGFGRGFYDRALADALETHQHLTHLKGAASPLLVGICYQWQLIEGEIPVEPHDIPMDVIATDEQVIYCSHGRLT